MSLTNRSPLRQRCDLLDPPVTAQSVALAKLAQQRERALFCQTTGLTLEEDGSIRELRLANFVAAAIISLGRR